MTHTRRRVSRRKSGVAPTPKVIPFPRVELVRTSRVASARARIAAGYYDRAEIQELLVDAVLAAIVSH